MIQTIIVDDEILSRIGIQSFIDGKEDISVSGVFESAEDAIEFLKINPVDIVITDIEMAQMNGLQFIKIIREKKLASGVIILSCHDDFVYAQEAISMGTDSYMLKYSVTEEKILAEIKKVYEKTKTAGFEVPTKEKMFRKSGDAVEDGKYVVGVLRVNSEAAVQDNDTHLDGTMMIHLLEGIVERYQMGTLFSPYNKELFIMFRFPSDISDRELKKNMETNIMLISKNMSQYISSKIVFGFSTAFTDLKLTREKYEEAVQAVELSFYETEVNCFFYQGIDENPEPAVFSASCFLEKDKSVVFENELNMFLQKAHFQKVSVSKAKEQLIQSVMLLVYQVMKEYNFSEEFLKKWKSEAMFISAIMLSGTESILKKKLLTVMEQFRIEISAELEKDDLSKVFAYIEQNLTQKITLSELTDISCMSVPSFSKKFKERTGLTAVEYINERRIEKARALMKNQNYSLWQIAEMTGFSNANYLVRVFKKVTGQTVSEYRRQYGIFESE